MAKHPPAAGKEPKIPAAEAGQLPNPPPMAPGEIQPDDFIFIKRNEETMTTPSHGATDHP